MSLELRRREMMQAENDIYEGFLMNTTLDAYYKIRMVMIQADLDDCWIKDSAGNYLFKGKNVE